MKEIVNNEIGNAINIINDLSLALYIQNEIKQALVAASLLLQGYEDGWIYFPL